MIVRPAKLLLDIITYISPVTGRLRLTADRSRATVVFLLGIRKGQAGGSRDTPPLSSVYVSLETSDNISSLRAPTLVSANLRFFDPRN